MFKMFQRYRIVPTPPNILPLITYSQHAALYTCISFHYNFASTLHRFCTDFALTLH